MTKLWDVLTGMEVRSFEGNFAASHGSIAFSPDGRYILTGSGSTVKLWRGVSIVKPDSSK
jgi:WD40 repeat protein